MSEAIAMAKPAPTPIWPMYRALVGVSILCGIIIVGVYEWTRPMIERNRAAALQDAVFEVLPGAESSRSFVWAADGFVPGDGRAQDGPAVHVGYDSEGGIVGLAIAADGMGYQDVISVLYGYSPEKQAIIGLAVLESRETPGLGDKIETDATFRANFEHLDVSLDAAGTALRNGIVAVERGAKTQAWQIDSITGATISSEAIAKILHESAGVWVPRIVGGRFPQSGGER